MEMFTSFPDIKGDSGLLIRAYKEREIFARSQTVMKYSIASIVLSIITGFVLLSILLQKIVIGPLNSLTQHVLAIGHSGDLTSQIKIQSDDEVGILATEFNSMLNKLNEAKHKVQEQSFQLGMAELASGILHNVRNSLHKMFSNNEQIRKTIDTIPVEKITMARQELSSTVKSEERKAALVDFLDEANASLLLFISKTKGQLDGNEPLVEEIENILQNFEKWTFAKKIVEKIQIKPVILDSYQLLEKSYRDSISIQIEPEVAEINFLTSNRVILIQVFMNLFTNAVESINRLENVQGQIRIEAELQDMGYGEAVHLRVQDNGAGMDKDVLLHVFKRGFTTKKIGSTGLGLHWCANAVESMNGRLYAESKGAGQGACFHLVLPQNI
jgi:signal transduction histidine kinase